MREIKQEHLKGERVLFHEDGLYIKDTIFSDGESPMKECRNIVAEGCMFEWRYPIWYSEHIVVDNCTFFGGARAGIWYTNDVTVKNSIMEAPKCIRRCDGVLLENVNISGGEETLWHCKNVRLRNVTARGEYFAMNSENMEIDGFSFVGKYSFDGVKNVTIRNAKLLTKDAFWNSENVTVVDSIITGEYIGWNAKNLTFVNCTIESLQGMCYIDNLVMKNCKLLGTTLAFEYSTVEADIVGKIDSVFNPTSGHITADHIDQLIIEKDRVDPTKTVIVCREKTAV